MKRKKFENDWERESHKQFVLFYSMCGKKDRAFFDEPEKNGTTEDYVRLMYIALAFGFKKMALRIVANVKNEDEFDCRLKELPKRGSDIIKWFDDFISEIPDEPIPGLKALAVEMWGASRKKIDPNNFNISDLFNE